MKKRLFCLFLSLSLALGLGMSALAAGQGYTDVAGGAWYYDYVTDLSGAGIIDGYPDGSFLPDEETTLGAALKLILLAAGYEEPAAPEDGHWARGYLDLALAEKLLSGKAETDLDSPVDRLLVGQVTAKALGLLKARMDSPFADTDDGYVLALYKTGVVTGSEVDGALLYEPDSGLTRAELAAIIWRVQNTDVHAGMLDCGYYWVDPMEGVAQNSYDKTAFAAADGRMTYSAAPYRTGIDVSFYQGDIDWDAVKADGIEFAMLRLGFRGYGAEGTLNMDERFADYMEGAAAAGLEVGVYFFSQAITVAEAEEEAAFVLDALADYDVTWPVVFDWEPVTAQGARTSDLDTDTLCAIANTFCEAVQAAGYTPMIYLTDYAGYVKYDVSLVDQWDFWYAGYTDVPGFYYDFQMWQYSDQGSVDGIAGRVDLNLSFVDYGA